MKKTCLQFFFLSSLVIVLKALVIIKNGTTLTIVFCFKTKTSLDFAILSKKKLDLAGW